MLINDGKSSAIRFPSVTLRENGDFVLPEKVDKFGRQGSRVLADNIYYNTKEIIGGHGRSHHHSLQPGNVGRILSEIPSGPDPIHNPDSPSARVYGWCVDGIDVFNIYKINCEILYTLDVLVQC